jgi:hypothetical protein
MDTAISPIPGTEIMVNWPGRKCGSALWSGTSTRVALSCVSTVWSATVYLTGSIGSSTRVRSCGMVLVMATRQRAGASSVMSIAAAHHY